MNFVFLTIVVVAVTACGPIIKIGEGKKSVERRIVLDSSTSNLQGSVPSIVALTYRQGESIIVCNGFLVGEETVLTAAHCLQEKKDDNSAKFIDATIANVHIGGADHAQRKRVLALLNYGRNDKEDWALLRIEQVANASPVELWNTVPELKEDSDISGQIVTYSIDNSRPTEIRLFAEVIDTEIDTSALRLSAELEFEKEKRENSSHRSKDDFVTDWIKNTQRVMIWPGKEIVVGHSGSALFFKGKAIGIVTKPHLAQWIPGIINNHDISQ
jgi:secreted trypsin-like serine protease